MIVITGASDGVGLEIAKLYQKAGVKVINVSRRESKYADDNFLADLTIKDELDSATDAILASSEKIEAVVNSIGVFTDYPFGQLDDQEIERVMKTNSSAPMLFISRLFNRIKKDEADVVNVVSRAGMYGSATNPVYSTSKWAERGFTLSLQEALKDTPCRVMSVCPGGIKTDLFEKADAGVDTKNWMSPEAIAIFVKHILDLPKNMEVSEVLINRKKLT